MKSIGNWFWVVASILAGITIFIVSLYFYSLYENMICEKKSIEQFEKVVNEINDLCWKHIGNSKDYFVKLCENVDGIYASTKKNIEYSKNDLIRYITSNEYSNGNYLCLQIRDRRVRCEELLCSVNFTFIGSKPIELSLSALINKALGRAQTFDYYLILNRSEDAVYVRKE
ncbi:MAG: hypothetical protein QXG91_00955 [Candidatus Aenigmatarchaeota archaeon]